MTKVKFSTIKSYIDSVTLERKEAISKLRKVINKNIPKGFQECINYNMIGRVVPHSRYPDGYHCDPKLPLPFMNLASQKSHIAVYTMGLYADEKLMNWFTAEYKKRVVTKLNMGKSCIRFKKVENIPYELIGELATKISVDKWIEIYETSRKK